MMQTAEALSEKVVAVLPSNNALGEQQLSQSITAIELQAESMTVGSDEDFQQAAEFGRELK